MQQILPFALSLFALCVTHQKLLAQLTFEPIGTYATGTFDESAAEIVAFDPGSARAFFTNAEANAVVALDLSDPNNPTLAFTLDMSPFGGGVNSVEVAGGRVAIAVEADEKTEPGTIVIYGVDGDFIETHGAGALPDALSFSRDGNYLAVANEGEPNDDYDADPVGSITLVDFTSGKGVSYTVGFERFIGQEDALRAEGIRIFGPGANAAQDLEPEYVSWSPDGERVYVTLQENNALAILERRTNELKLVPLGYKDHNTDATGFDASNRDDGIEIFPRPTLGMYQPDAIKTYVAADGATYVVTANEGDSRDYDGFSEETRVKDLVLDPTAFPDAARLQQDENLGRLLTTTTLGDTDGDGDFDEIYSYGSRSFSILAADGSLVFDSGNEFEKTVAGLLPAQFNSNNDDNDSRKSRSDDKGPEPEAVAVAELNGRTYALIGLERQSAIVVYDVTDPRAAAYVTLFGNRDYGVGADSVSGGDLGPEDIDFVSAEDSPSGEPLVLVSSEVSGTVTVYRVLDGSERFTLQLLHNGAPVTAGTIVPTGSGQLTAFASTLDSLRYAAFLRNRASILLGTGNTVAIEEANSLGSLRYDAFGIGEQDLAAGTNSLLQNTSSLQAGGSSPTFVSVNAHLPAPVVTSSILYRRTTPMGVIGLTGVAGPAEVAAVNAEVANLRSKGVAIVLLLTDGGGDVNFVGQTYGVDIVVSGASGGRYLTELLDADGRTVYRVANPEGYGAVGQLLVTFGADGEVVAVGAESGLVPVVSPPVREAQRLRLATSLTAASFAIAPNPANGAIRIRGDQPVAGNRVLRICDTAGKTMLLQNTDSPAGYYEEVVPLDLSTGVYTATLTTPSGSASEVLLVQ